MGHSLSNNTKNQKMSPPATDFDENFYQLIEKIIQRKMIPFLANLVSGSEDTKVGKLAVFVISHA